MKYIALVHPDAGIAEAEISDRLKDWIKEQSATVEFCFMPRLELEFYHSFLAPQATKDEFWNPDSVFLVPDTSAHILALRNS